MAETVVLVMSEGDHEATLYWGAFTDLETAAAAYGYTVADLIPDQYDEDCWSMGWRTVRRFTLNSEGDADAKRDADAESEAAKHRTPFSLEQSLRDYQARSDEFQAALSARTERLT